MMYDFETEETFPLQGHRNAVRTLSATSEGKWLLTADFEEDSVVVVWDTESGVPICTLFSPHEESGLTAARISPNAKYIVTVGNEKVQRVHFWLWTHGRDVPDAFAELSDTPSERVKEISFNDMLAEQFALTTDYHVLFFTWTNDGLKHFCPQITDKTRRLGIFNSSCYVPEAQQVLTATTKGFVLVWSNTVERDKETGTIKNINEHAKHVKSVHLQKNEITVMLHHEGMIVTGDSEGRINFYDTRLRILYWCQNCGLDSIRSISFDLRSSLLGPIAVGTESELEFGESDEGEGEGLEEIYSDTENDDCQEKQKYSKNFQPFKHYEGIPSKFSANIERTFKSYDKKEAPNGEFVDPVFVPTDASLHNSPLNIRNFFVCTSTGILALLDISKSKCYFIFQCSGGSVTSLDAHPESNYVVTGNAGGVLCLYNYHERNLVVSRKPPPLPDFRRILDNQATSNNIVYVTCPRSHESLTAITVLRYSPKCDVLVCGMENGAIWMLHPITLEAFDKTPYKHSTESILKIAFTNCAEYMAYADNALVVAVFKRNARWPEEGNVWNFLGKYHSHYLPIRDVLFGPPASNQTAPRLFSLGEDGDLVEYDLENSGPYPEPGLKILQVDRIEYSATPLCLSWYPRSGAETFLVISNSEYKYRLLNDVTKMIRGTFLGPTFGAPVQNFQILHTEGSKNNNYTIFVTEKEIGLQLFPFDGNPYKAVGMIGHPRKIIQISISHDGVLLFTVGYNDPCVLMWKIKYRSVDVMARLGGSGLSPFYCLIEGGRNGWLINEMQDLFYYAQILHQGENTTATRIVSDKVSAKQIPNLMRAIGFYPSNEEIEILMGEISHKHYAETGQLVQEITFEELVKLYVNHRPAFGVSLRQMKEAFCAFLQSEQKRAESEDDPTLTQEQFLDILFGRGPEEFPAEGNRPFGEPLTSQEAHMYLSLLVPSDDTIQDYEKGSLPKDFSFLPERISYKDFTTDIMGIELPEETRADNE